MQRIAVTLTLLAFFAATVLAVLPVVTETPWTKTKTRVETVTVERPVEVIRTVTVEKPVEVVRTVTVDKLVEVVRTVTVTVTITPIATPSVIVVNKTQRVVSEGQDAIAVDLCVTYRVAGVTETNCQTVLQPLQGRPSTLPEIAVKRGSELVQCWEGMRVGGVLPPCW